MSVTWTHLEITGFCKQSTAYLRLYLSRVSSSNWFRSQAIYSRAASVILGHQDKSKARNFCKFSAINSTPSSVILLQPDRLKTVKFGRECTETVSLTSHSKNKRKTYRYWLHRDWLSPNRNAIVIRPMNCPVSGKSNRVPDRSRGRPAAETRTRRAAAELPLPRPHRLRLCNRWGWARRFVGVNTATILVPLSRYSQPVPVRTVPTIKPIIYLVDCGLNVEKAHKNVF